MELKDDPAAVVLCQVGRGLAILLGIHLEYSAVRLHRNNPYIERIFSLLEKGELARKEAFRELLKNFNLKIS